MAEAPQPVVVAFDGSPEALEAVRTAGSLFAHHHILVVTVWEPGLAMIGPALGGTDLGAASYVPPPPEQIKAIDEEQDRRAQQTAGAGVRIASELGAEAEPVSVADDGGDIAATIAALAEQRDAAAIVAGSRGLGRVKSALLGSTSRRLLQETRRPLLIVRTPRDQEE